MRFLVSLILALLAAMLARADDLTVNGDTGMVEVERQIVVKEKLTLAKKLPVTINAPAGGFGYSWDVPSTVKANQKKDVLEIIEGRGVVTIGLKWTMIDFEKKTVTDKSASITLVLIEVKPPEPTDPLYSELRKLFDADSAADKAATVQKLAGAYRYAAQATQDKAVTTIGVLVDALTNYLKSIDGKSLSALRERIGAELEKTLPLDDGPLTDTLRKSIGDAYTRIATLLEAIK